VTLPQFTIGGVSATVGFARMSEAGLFQFNLIVPDGAGTGDQVLQASVNGVIPPAGFFITFQ
jgi:uncharacterized protein (TIGR03437 family)